MRNHDVRGRLQLVLQAALLTTASLPGCGGRVGSENADDASVPNSCGTPPIEAAITTGCSYILPVSGDVDACGLPIGQSLDSVNCERLCHRATGCDLSVTNGAHVECQVACPVARRTDGLVLSCSPRNPPVGGFFAHVAALEAASVDAFARLEADLLALEAPLSLLLRARRAAADEARHATLVEALARRFGARPCRHHVPRREDRSLESIARENAAEGCVRETYGSLVATWQAHFARDVLVRKSMRRIARDEVRHAKLAWDVASFLEPKLGTGALRRVRDARRFAVDGLRAEMERELPARIRHSSGMPSGVATRALFERAERAFWV